VEVEGGHQKTAEPKAEVCMKKAGTERFRNRFFCQRAQRAACPLPTIGICILIDYGADYCHEWAMGGCSYSYVTAPSLLLL
jgi:hypothetical protein